MKNKRIEKRKARERHMSWAKSFARRIINLRGAIANRKEREERRIPDAVQRSRIINRMTNWQRNQAGRACKGRWQDLSIGQLEYYADLEHWKRATA